MLEKKEKNCVFDAHFHYFDCKKLDICQFPENWQGISCAHSEIEWNVQKLAPENVLQSYGMHPLNADKENIPLNANFLEELIQTKKIVAIGECGFDYFDNRDSEYLNRQVSIWNIQLDLAISYKMPLIIHCRKANEKLFEYSKQLSRIPEVLFHSFMGTADEGLSLLRRNINGYFSFGKQIFNNNKKVLDCIKNLPFERIHGETDAPFQFLKGEKYTHPKEILNIIEAMNSIRE